MKIGRDVQIAGRIKIINYGTILLSNGVKINSKLSANPISHNQCSFYTTSKGKIYIGEQSGLSGCTIYSSNSIEIGARVLIGAGTHIYDTDFHSLQVTQRHGGDKNIKTSPVIIEDDTFIGANVTILKGVRIGKGSVVAACSVVTKSIGCNELWGGNPAMLIRDKINE